MNPDWFKPHELKALKPLLAKAKAEGWSEWIRTKSDYFAVLEGCYFEISAAEKFRTFCKCLRQVNGKFKGKPLELMEWQWRDVIGPLFGWFKADGFRRFRRAFVTVPKKNGKALALDTPIATPSGWTTMGQLAVGDQVFDENGQPCSVVATTGVMLDRSCYEVEFSDGAKIIADAEHEWVTRTVYSEGKEKTRTTAEIAATLTKKCTNGFAYNHAVRLAGALELPEADLPIHPYVLGAWLGDGLSKSGALVYSDSDREILEHIRACGETAVEVGQHVSAYDRTKFADCYQARLGSWKDNCDSYADYHSSGFKPLRVRLRELGVQSNKHIPTCYLRASFEQRLALLQGLMDTDGSIAKTGKTSKWSMACEFANTNRRLAYGVWELALSLGLKATISEKRSIRGGKHYGGVDKGCGVAYRVCFSTYADVPVFRLSRKVARLPQRPQKRTSSQSRRIVAVRPIQSVPVKCIQVDSPSHLYLAGREMIPTHNSGLAAAIAIYMTLCDGESGANCFCAATDKKQAGLVWTEAAKLVKASPALRKYLQVFRGSKTISFDAASSMLTVISGDTHNSEGLDAHLIIYDELHMARTSELLDIVEMAGDARTQSLVPFIITTAGGAADPNNVCYSQYSYAKQILEGETVDTSYLACIYEAPKSADISDPKVWRLANPSMGVTFEEATIAKVYQRATQSGRFANFRRRRLNQWVKDEDFWIDRENWDKCQGEFPDFVNDLPCWCGLDTASTLDFSAFVKLWKDEESGKFYVKANFWLPEQTVKTRIMQGQDMYQEWRDNRWLTVVPGIVTSPQIISADIERELQTLSDLQEIAYDNAHNIGVGPQLYHDGYNGVKKPLAIGIGNGGKQITAAMTELERLIMGGLLVHDGNPILGWMLGNVVLDEHASGSIRPNKKKSGRGKIDGIVAMIYALSRLLDNSGPREKSPYNKPEEEICTFL